LPTALVNLKSIDISLVVVVGAVDTVDNPKLPSKTRKS